MSVIESTCLSSLTKYTHSSLSIDRGELRYASKQFVTRVVTIYHFLVLVLPLLINTKGILKCLENYLTLVVMKCDTFQCSRTVNSETHNERLMAIMLSKLVGPVLKNYAGSTDLGAEPSTYHTYQKSSQRRLRTVKNRKTITLSSDQFFGKYTTYVLKTY